MNILVTGGAGFIGSHLVDRLIADGHSVHVIDNLSSGKKEQVNEKAVFHHLDLGEHSAISSLFAKESFDAVYHLAAQMNVRKSVADPTFDARENIVNTIHLLECCAAAQIQKFVFSSTGGAIYGDTVVPTPEHEEQKPVSPYGCAKLAVENYLHYYKEVHGVPYTILRFANVYGPRQNPHGEAGVVAIFLEKIFAEENPVIYGGDQTRDYIYVDDIVSACVAALSAPSGEVYNVGCGTETSVTELFTHLNALFDNALSATYQDKKKGEQEKSCLDCNKALRELGWKPTVPLQEGLQKTVAWTQKTYGKT